MRQLATLSYAGVEPTTASALQAAVWWNGLGRLGVSPPLVVVHDLGFLLSRPRAARLPPGPICGPPAAAGGGRGRAGPLPGMLEAVASSEARTALESALTLRDEVVVILLARLLGDLHRRWSSGARNELLAHAAAGLAAVQPAIRRPDASNPPPGRWAS